jgi:hypothetical protein
MMTTSNFVLLHASLPDVAKLVAATVQVREAVSAFPGTSVVTS